MFKQFAFAPPIFAALAVSISASALLLPSSPAYAAETCIAAPKLPSPQGSRWYYRLERGTQRKCWHLVQADQKTQSAAARPAPQLQPADEAAAPPAAAPLAVAEKSLDRLPESTAQQAPAWITKSVSATPFEAAPPVQPPAPLDRTAERQTDQTPAPFVVAQNQANPAPAVQAPPAIEPPAPQPVVSRQTDTAGPASGGTSILQFALGALAIIGLLAGAIFGFAAVGRRRADVLNTVPRDDEAPLGTRHFGDDPTFAPMPPMNLMPEHDHDDVGEAMRRSPHGGWRRRAA